MELILTPSFEEIFQEERPSLNELLFDIPSNTTIKAFAYISSRLHKDSSLKNQVIILKELLRRQEKDTLDTIFKNFSSVARKSLNGREVSIFADLYIKAFIHFELTNYRDFSIEDTTPQQELNIYKAYLVIVSQKLKEATEIYDNVTNSQNDYFFQIHTWPILFNQLEATNRQEPISSMIRAICFFNYLQYHSDYEFYVHKFLEKNGQKSSWEYVLAFMNILNLNWKSNSNDNIPFFFTCDDKLKPLFNSLCVDQKEYSKIYEKDKENYRLLKSKPLFKYGDRYIVLDWDLIINKIYDGLLFDFFERSGIDQHESFKGKGIPGFKKFIGNEITEKFTFQRTIEGILKKKYASLIFPTDDSRGEPDAYFRRGNTIILFEIKDAFFADKALKSGSYSEIKEEIDKKYNNSRKGIGQIIRQLKKLQKSPFEEKEYHELNLKPRNLVIYPVIIYTDINFGTPGVINYLINEFEKEINANKLTNSFKNIKKLTFLNFNFLLNSFSLFRKFGFLDVIDNLHQETQRRQKKHNYKREIPLLFKYNDNQETIIESLFDIDRNERLDIEEIMKLLNMTEGLPIGESTKHRG